MMYKRARGEGEDLIENEISEWSLYNVSLIYAPLRISRLRICGRLSVDSARIELDGWIPLSSVSSMIAAERLSHSFLISWNSSATTRSSPFNSFSLPGTSEAQSTNEKGVRAWFQIHVIFVHLRADRTTIFAAGHGCPLSCFACRLNPLWHQ